ncbi:flagellar motor protein MotB [Erythrobacter sp. HL-111]|uniref:flagellar motor protein MotB n=1 Tax=Erythrobacter sp. HL-111 TaxID=1798193 RepID=UPI0006D97221|nr:flagellar motor protein MotB [Erythrobacter sp. HL-111]KPP92573.1 MAG: flagellar motor rotation protein MotB [Erythrobacteraceae bacterium HL-111]SDS92631.1 chemotaxis protein MotB [Erythrobacter sp. HL-111]
MAEADPKPAGEIPAPVIVKKVTIEEAGHHGGAWKVAYADFVTAMMAFFLLLWLLGATEEDQRKGIADYFTPTLVKMRQKSAGADGMLGGSSITDVDSYPNAMGQTGTRAITIPRGVTGGPVEGGGRGEMEADQLRELREAIEDKLVQRRELQHLARQVRVLRAPEGIRIDLMDDADFSMFALGTTILTGEAEALLAIIGETLAEEGAPLILRGHTDSLPWRPGVPANNWSLSAGRAEATRQELIRTGIPATRFARIEGVADREPVITANPEDPRNRRISLLLLDPNARAMRQRPDPGAFD